MNKTGYIESIMLLIFIIKFDHFQHKCKIVHTLNFGKYYDIIAF